MKAFRIQEHTPDTYSKQSRDFQLLCNVFDCMNGAVKYDIDSILDVKDLVYCNDRLLNLLQTKLGFFTSLSTDANTQRIILRGFPYIIKHKGSSIGIIQAIQLFLRSQNLSGKVRVDTTNEEVTTTNFGESIATGISNSYVVSIALDNKLDNIKLLEELLSYVVPAGYSVEYGSFANEKTSKVENSDSIRILFAKEFTNRRIVATEDEYDGETGLPIGSVSGARILSINDSTPTSEKLNSSLYEVKNIPHTPSKSNEQGDES